MGRIKPPKVDLSFKFPPHYKTDFNPEKHPPYFSLRYLSNHKDFSMDSHDKIHKAAFADKLYELSQISWEQIKRSHKHGLGFEKIDQKSIKATIPYHITPDVKLIAFRYKELAPMVGYRENATFFLIWFDSKFCLYDHE